MRGLKDKFVLITGGAGGIGRVTAARFLEEGARVVVFDKDESACRLLEKELPGIEPSISVDVSDADSVAKAFEKYDAQFDKLDILINNAGISYRHSFLKITPEEWQTVMSINLNGIFLLPSRLLRGCLKEMGV